MSNRAVIWPRRCPAYFFSSSRSSFTEKDRVMLLTRSTGGFFNLSRLRAKTKRILIRELPYADDATLVAHPQLHLQNLCDRLSKVCSDFSMTISLKKTVVMSLGTPNPPRILINGSLLKVVDRFSYLGSVVNSSKSPDDEIKCSTNLKGFD